LKDYRVERLTALFVAVAIVGVVLYLVIRNKPFADPNLVVVLRIILSLACGVLGFSIPGFIEVQYNLRGFSIRAFGAAALFVIAYFGTPRVNGLHLSKADIELDEIKLVDLRSELSGADHTEPEVANSTALLTVPLSFRSVEEPAKRAIIEKTTAQLSANGTSIDFVWDQFVNMHEENYGKWLGIKESAHPLTVDPGSLVHEEVLHRPTRKATWNEVVALFSAGSLEPGFVTVRALSSGRTLERNCQFNLKYWSEKVQNYIQSEKKIPGRITMDCAPMP
jgi:hypothetical protein